MCWTLRPAVVLVAVGASALAIARPAFVNGMWGGCHRLEIAKAGDGLIRTKTEACSPGFVTGEGSTDDL